MAASRVLGMLIQAGAVTRLAHPGRRFAGLEANQLQVLMALAHHREQTVNGLSERLVLDRTTVSHGLRMLEARGLVVRRQDPKDGRRWLNKISPAGVKLVREFLDQLPPELTRRAGPA